MHIVIDIPDEVYKEVSERIEWDTLTLGLKLIDAVQSGIRLPKGHGRLIDVDYLYENTEICHSDKDGYACVRWKDVNDAPTIIEGSDSE